MWIRSPKIYLPKQWYSDYPALNECIFPVSFRGSRPSWRPRGSVVGRSFGAPMVDATRDS